jgi:hypothetical protein
LSHTSSPFCSGYFGDQVSGTICLGWPPTMILLISAFQVARMIGVSCGAQQAQILYDKIRFCPKVKGCSKVEIGR